MNKKKDSKCLFGSAMTVCVTLLPELADSVSKRTFCYSNLTKPHLAKTVWQPPQENKKMMPRLESECVLRI